MKYILRNSAAALAVLCVLPLHATRSVSFGLDAFNEVVPAASGKTAFFSPYGFELDCASLAEAFDSIGRAGVAEKMGILTDFDGIYLPLVARYEGDAAATNAISIKTARALCLPDISFANIEYRKRIWDMNGTSVCQNWPVRGAERWFQAKMDGMMEDFRMPISIKHDPTEYHFIELVYVRALIPWHEGTLDGPASFFCADLKTRSLPFARLRREISWRTTRDFTAVRIPMRDGAVLYLAKPAKDRTLADARSAIRGDTIADFFASFDSVTQTDVGTGVADVFLPTFDITTEVDLTKGFIYALVPQTGFMNIRNSLTHREAFQRVRFHLGLEAPPKADDERGDSANAQDGKKMQVFPFTSPFLFILRYPDTDVAPVIGQFTGTDQHK